MNEHTVKSYEEELALLDKKIAQMGGLAEQLLGKSLEALERRDPKVAEEVVAADRFIDTLERQIEDQVISMIARRQPMADDLRHIMGALRITTDLERIGDLAKNIAKRALAIADELHPKPLISGIRHMVELALHQLKEVLDAYAERDADKALAVWRNDARDRRDVQLAVPRAADLHDGGSAQHRHLHASPVRRQEHRARRRSHDQHRRDGALPRARLQHHGRSSQGRSDEFHAYLGHLMAEGGAISMSAKVLIVEDEAPLAEMLRYNLEAEGFRVMHAETGEEALVLLQEEHPDLVVLDWMLPGVSGIELCRRLRSKSDLRGVPIIMLTARGEETDRIRGLSTGADDYVVKPFSLPELMARVKAILRRTAPDRMAEVLKIGDIELDRAAHKVTRGLRQVRLGPTEFRLLEFLMESSGRVLSRAQLLDGVWGRDAFVDERTVDVHVGRLRKALIRGNERDPIRTVRSAGYVFGDNSAFNE